MEVYQIKVKAQRPGGVVVEKDLLFQSMAEAEAFVEFLESVLYKDVQREIIKEVRKVYNTMDIIEELVNELATHEDARK